LRKIELGMSISLDGFFAGPNGELDWHNISEELHWHFNEHLGAMSAFLDGRVMHEMMAEFWPTADADPASTHPMVEFSGIWRDMPKFVYSKTLEHADWNATIVREVDPDEIRRLKAQPGGDMAVGGAVLAAEFMRLSLLDECWLYVQPVILGEGRPLFPADVRAALRLVETRRFDNGVVLLRYDCHSG
jgi:dihydrofolate reductase